MRPQVHSTATDSDEERKAAKRRELNRAAVRRYRATEKGKASVAKVRRNHAENGKSRAAWQRYATSKAGRAQSKISQKKYLTSEHGQLKRRRHRKSSYHQVRARLFEKFGGACEACGLTDRQVLQLDHRDGGGNVERKLRHPEAIYERAIAEPSTYALLCATCNFEKRLATDNPGRSQRQQAIVARARAAELRPQALAAIGGARCACCGYDGPAIHIDHRDGGGRVERKTVGTLGIIKRALTHPEKYQPLCPNCNARKRIHSNEDGRKPC